MLAYDADGVLCEFEENNFLAVCEKCRRIYCTDVRAQMPGFREMEDDCCPYCGNNRESSMSYEYHNSPINEYQLRNLAKKSLFDTVIHFCDSKYQNSTCNKCNHIEGCPSSPKGRCKQCLEDVHYPDRNINGKKDYDCDRMINYYVCTYAEKYASEMLYLMRKSSALREINDYHVLSIGCGACPDLMAIERYCHECSTEKTVSYLGIDKNELWRSIHEKINSYRTSTINKTTFWYMDAVADDFNIPDANVVILQYVISHFYNTEQIDLIQSFFQKLVEGIVANKQKDVPMVIMINDVNSNNRGRDYFEDLVHILNDMHFRGTYSKCYFDYCIKNSAQQYGFKHESTNTIFKLPQSFEHRYGPWHDCSSAQLLIEIR